MRITIRQLRSLIKEAVEVSTTYNNAVEIRNQSLGLKNISTAQDMKRKRIFLLDPETDDKYRIFKDIRRVDLCKPDWECMNVLGRYTQQTIVILDVDNVYDMPNFIETAYKHIAKSVADRRKTLSIRKKHKQKLIDRNEFKDIITTKYWRLFLDINFNNLSSNDLELLTKDGEFILNNFFNRDDQTKLKSVFSKSEINKIFIELQNIAINNDVYVTDDLKQKLLSMKR